MAYLNPQNLIWIAYFRSRILLADAHSKHILIILIVDSHNFRKLQGCFSEFERDENMTQKRTSNRLLIKRWNFSRMSILRGTYLAVDQSLIYGSYPNMFLVFFSLVLSLIPVLKPSFLIHVSVSFCFSPASTEILPPCLFIFNS